MKIRFQADNDVDQRIIDAVMRLAPDCDFKSASEAGFHTGTPDPEVLRITAEDNRVLVSHDLKTLPRRFGESIAQHNSPAVLIIQQEVAIRDAALWLKYFYEVGASENFFNTIRTVSRAF